ncbi:MAG: hypothetical protein HFE78_08285 [Clostridiales bacterium]|nr:hypothetical protein [Clostridiales bacterium]
MKTKKLALCAMLSALGCTLLLVGSFSDLFDLTFACSVSFIVVFTVIELKRPYPLLVYFVTGTISIFILPVKFAALVYLLFSGIYPIIKGALETRLHNMFLLWFVKLLYFNAVLTAIIVIAKYILLPTEQDLMPVFLYVMGNLTFVLFDYALTKLISLYLFKLRAKLRIGRLLK